MLTFGSRGASFACTDFCYCRAQPLILGDADPPWIVPGIISDDEKKAYLRHTIGAHAAPAYTRTLPLRVPHLGALAAFGRRMRWARGYAAPMALSSAPTYAIGLWCRPLEQKPT